MSEEKKEEKRQSLFSLARGAQAVIRTDPHVAMTHSGKIFEVSELPEMFAEQTRRFLEMKAMLDAANSVIASQMPHYTPWPISNEAFLVHVSFALRLLSTAMEEPPRLHRDRDLESNKRAIERYMHSYDIFIKMAEATILKMANLVAMGLPAKIRSNALNEERAGASMS